MESKRAIIYNLTLSEAEADWLREVMRNPLYPDTEEEEYKEDSEMREKFFNALKEK